MRRFAWYALLVLLTISAVVLVWQLRYVVVIFLLSIATAAAFQPFIAYFSAKGLPRYVALIIPYASLLVLLVVTLFVISNPLIRDMEQLSSQVAIDYERIFMFWPDNGTPFQRSLVKLLPPAEELYSGMAGEEATWMVQAALGFTSGAAAFLGTLAIIFVLSLYWSADRDRMERLLLSLFPVEQRTQARQIWRGIEKGVGAYIRSELTQSLLAGILLWLGYRLMGLDYPVLLALLGALAWLIPWFGAILAIIPPFLVATGSGYPLAALAVIYTLVVLYAQEYIIEPRIFSRRSYSSVVLVLVVLILADVLGLIGLILAPLVSAALQIVFKYAVQSPMAAASARLANKEKIQGVEALQARLAETRAEVGNWEAAPVPEISNLIERLDHLVEEIRSSLH